MKDLYQSNKKDTASIRARDFDQTNIYIMEIIDRRAIHNLLKPVAESSHKGSYGHSLLIGGSYGKIGAITLTVKAALRSGCGVATAYIPRCGYDIMQVAIPEAMVITDSDERYITDINYDIKPHAIAIGPGLGQEPATLQALEAFLRNVTVPVVVDADALNLLATNPRLLSLLKPNMILTPHPKELGRLVGQCYSLQDQLERAVRFSQTYNVTIVMKGAPTNVITPKMVYLNTTGNAALATAGSGDVLTGIITGLAAQGYTCRDACLLGVFLHGLTADIALPDFCRESFIASDVIQHLGKAFHMIRSVH